MFDQPDSGREPRIPPSVSWSTSERKHGIVWEPLDNDPCLMMSVFALWSMTL